MEAVDGMVSISNSSIFTSIFVVWRLWSVGGWVQKKRQTSFVKKELIVEFPLNRRL